MDRRNVLFGVAHRHRQLELAERRDCPARPVRDLDRRVQVHVRGAQMANCERVAAEVHGVEAVVHHELRAEWVIHARPEHVWLGREELPQPLAGILVSRCRDFITLREEGRGDKIHQDLQVQTAKRREG